jgi:hypothetical protein
MIIKSVVFSLLLFATMISCKVVDQFTKFNLAIKDTITINPTLAINVPFDIPTLPIPLNTTSTFELNNTHKDLIEEIYLSELKMTIIRPEGEDFSILKSIEIYIQAAGLEKQKIAWLDSISSTATSIKLNVSNSDLKDYILKDNIELIAKTVTDEINTREYKIAINVKFLINARILGI